MLTEKHSLTMNAMQSMKFFCSRAVTTGSEWHIIFNEGENNNLHLAPPRLVGNLLAQKLVRMTTDMSLIRLSTRSKFSVYCNMKIS